MAKTEKRCIEKHIRARNPIISRWLDFTLGMHKEDWLTITSKIAPKEQLF